MGGILAVINECVGGRSTLPISSRVLGGKEVVEGYIPLRDIDILRPTELYIYTPLA
jgi:hypothetical protein